MARKRMITPTIWTNAKFLKLDYFERLLFIGLISFSDDEGYHVGDLRQIKAEIFPADNVDLNVLDKGLKNLVAVGLIENFGNVFRLLGWHEHQVIKKPQPSRLKPKVFPTSSESVEHKGIEEKRREERA